jgi:polyhydroxyalkanoate synthase
MFKLFADKGEKVKKGYDTLASITEVEVGATTKELVFQSEKIKLFKYHRDTPATYKTPVLISYALVNRHDMLDLQPDRSFIKNLLGMGLEVYVIDWGYPTRADRFFTMDDYVNWFLNDMVNFVRKDSGEEKITLMGICQGGTLSLIYSALHPDKIKNLVTLVTPVDFSTNDGLLFKWAKDINFDKLVDHYGAIPGDFLNTGFSMLKPMGKISKGMSVLDTMQDKAKLENFLRMEKWIADSPDQAGECYRQFMKDLYQKNKLVKGDLVIGGKKVNLKNITMPLLNVYATEDNLVPPAATIPLNDLVGTKDNELYKFSGGHIGVFVGGKSQKELAPAVGAWLKKRD